MVLRAVIAGEPDPVVITDLDEDQTVELRQMLSDAARKHRWLASCPECHGRLHVRRLNGGGYILAHNPGHGRCSLAARESDQHNFLKLHVCAAAQKVPGYTATVEHPTDSIDPDTRRPAILDVFADRTDGKRDPWGFEIQLSPIDEGKIRNRHERRAADLRCNWITTTKPSWSERIPWHQVSRGTDESRCLVVDGVRERIGIGGGRIEIVNVDPFPEKAMVQAILKRKLLWVEFDGWTWPGFSAPTPRRRRPKTTSASVTEWCSRNEDLPPEAAGFDEDEWQWRAHIAHSRLRVRDPLDRIDEAALSRYPAASLLDDMDVLATKRVLDKGGRL